MIYPAVESTYAISCADADPLGYKEHQIALTSINVGYFSLNSATLTSNILKMSARITPTNPEAQKDFVSPCNRRLLT